MEEKVVIKSQKSSGGLVAIPPVIGIFLALLMWFVWGVITGDTQFIKDYLTYDDEVFLCIVLAVAIVGIVLGFIFHMWSSKCELTVTDKRVYGKAGFGKRVDLPLDSVSAIGSRWLKGITIATSSGKIDFLLVENRDEIHRCVSKLLLERQNKTASVTTIKQEIPQSNADELKKYKNLLDSGVITQEEFDSKKKQLLGL